MSIAVEAARPIPLARELSLRRLMERRDPPSEELKLGHAVPQMLMVVLVAVLYAAIAPLIRLLYISGSRTVYRKHLLLVYTKTSEGGGAALFPRSRTSRRWLAPVWQSFQLALLFIPGVIRQDGRARRRLAPGAWRWCPCPS